MATEKQKQRKREREVPPSDSVIRNSATARMLMDYLQMANFVPGILANVPMPDGIEGQWDPVTNQIQVNDEFNTSALVHELTHSAQDAIIRQAENDPRLRDAVLKLMEGVGLGGTSNELLSQDSPIRQAGPEYRAYRSTPYEQQAHGMGEMLQDNPIPTGHLDATRAQEFMIMLDLAMRGRRNPNESD